MEIILACQFSRTNLPSAACATIPMWCTSHPELNSEAIALTSVFIVPSGYKFVPKKWQIINLVTWSTTTKDFFIGQVDDTDGYGAGTFNGDPLIFKPYFNRLWYPNELTFNELVTVGKVGVVQDFMDDTFCYDRDGYVEQSYERAVEAGKYLAPYLESASGSNFTLGAMFVCKGELVRINS